MVEERRMMDVTALILILITVASQSHGQKIVHRSATACFGTQTEKCDFYELGCETGYRIRIISAIYGLKTKSCNSGRQCFRKRDGCCVYNDNDCTGDFSTLHLYNLYTACSMRQRCGPLQATQNILCNNKPSTYVHIEYECVPEGTILPMCSGGNMRGTAVNLVFDGTDNMYRDRTECKCFAFLSSQGDGVIIWVDDVRMTSRTTENPGSVCSSANLTLLYANSEQLPQCSNSKNEEENFLRNLWQVSDDPLYTGFSLSRLYENGANDRPTMVWLTLNASEESNMQVSCTAPTTPARPATSPGTSPGTSPATSPAYTVSTTPANGTAGSQTDDGGNSGAVVAGVLIPLILLIIAGLVVGYFFWKKRKKKQLSKIDRTTRPNSYTDDFEVYDEIGHIPDDPEPPIYDPVYEPPLYDRVYEPGNRGSAGSNNSHSNGHLQVDQPRISTVSFDVQVPTKAPKQSSKNPFRLVSARTDRLFAWFRNQTGNSSMDVASGKSRQREASDCSYDHIKKARPVIVRVTSPDETHVYSHTNNSPPPSVTNPAQRSPKGGRISKDLSAVDCGDSYIEFTFDTIDRNDPKLVKPQPGETDANLKPIPPSRPLPSPTESPRNSARSASPLLAQQGAVGSGAIPRPKSPALLSPLPMGETSNRPMYDYAESQPSSRRGSDASRSDISDHSYKILEKQQEYDYAAPLDGVDHADICVDDDDNSAPVYEDVEERSRSNSVSSTGEPVYECGYEVPIKLQTPPEPPSVNTKLAAPTPVVNASPDMGRLNKELLQANKLKPLKPVGDKSPSVSPKLATKKDSASAKVVKPNTNKGNTTNKDKAMPKTKTSTDSSAEYVNTAKRPKAGADKTKRAPSKITLREETSDAPSHVKSDNVKTKDYEQAEKLKGVRNMAQLFESNA